MLGAFLLLFQPNNSTMFGLVNPLDALSKWLPNKRSVWSSGARWSGIALSVNTDTNIMLVISATYGVQ